MIRAIRRIFRRRDPHSLAVLAYHGAPKGDRRRAYKALRAEVNRQLRAHLEGRT